MIQFHPGTGLVAVAQLTYDAQQRVVEHRGVDHHQRGEIVVFVDLSEIMVWKNDDHSMFLSRIRIFVVSHSNIAAMNDTNDVIGRGKQLFIQGQSSDIIKDNDVVIPDFLCI